MILTYCMALERQSRYYISYPTLWYALPFK